MLRRTVLVSLSALGVAACANTRAGPRAAPSAPAELEVVLVDAQTPFGDGPSPYLTALRDEKPVSEAGLQWHVQEDYGRDDGATVRAPLVAVAEDRAVLADYFARLPGQWQLPSTHGIRYERASWAPRSAAQHWGARVVKLPPVVTGENIVEVQAQEDAVWLRFDDDGAAAFEAASAANIGQKIAFVVDGEIVADPVINDRITGGRVQVSLQGGPEAHRALAERFA